MGDDGLDEIYGNNGADKLDGGDDDDKVRGGDGGDGVYGGDGVDDVGGGLGADDVCDGCHLGIDCCAGDEIIPEAECAEIHGINVRFNFTISRNHDNGRLGMLPIHLAQQTHTVHPRHINITDN